MIGELNDEEIEDILHHQVLGRLACHAGGKTYIVPVSFAYNENCLYIHSREGQKTKMMRENPEVCFETDTMQNMANWKSVIAWGRFEELKDKRERDKALNHLVARILPIVSSETTHLSPHWPFPPDNMDEIKGVVFRIKLSKKTGRFEKNEIRLS